MAVPLKSTQTKTHPHGLANTFGGFSLVEGVVIKDTCRVSKNICSVEKLKHSQKAMSPQPLTCV